MTATVARGTQQDLDQLARDGLGFEEYALQASEIVRSAVPFDGFCMGLADPSTNLLTRSVKVGLGTVADGPFLYWEYAENDIAHFSELATRAVGVSVLEQETGGDKQRSGRFREVISTQIGAEHELRGVTRVGGFLWGTYAMYRAPGAAPFNAAEADYLQRLENTLAIGLRASTIVAVASSAAAQPGAGPAVLVFSERGELVQATPAASERVDDLGGSVEGDLPVPVTSILSALRGTAGSLGVGAAQIRARGRSGRWYSLHAAPFPADAAGRRSFAVTVEAATPPQILPLLIAAYGLTEREATIVQSMLRGESTHAIAQALFLSPYTVQDHFKSIFEKIGVSSRREVATRVFYGQYLGTGAP